MPTSTCTTPPPSSLSARRRQCGQDSRRLCTANSPLLISTTYSRVTSTPAIIITFCCRDRERGDGKEGGEGGSPHKPAKPSLVVGYGVEHFLCELFLLKPSPGQSCSCGQTKGIKLRKTAGYRCVSAGWGWLARSLPLSLLSVCRLFRVLDDMSGGERERERGGRRKMMGRETKNSSRNCTTTRKHETDGDISLFLLSRCETGLVSHSPAGTSGWRWGWGSSKLLADGSTAALKLPLRMLRLNG